MDQWWLLEDEKENLVQDTSFGHLSDGTNFKTSACKIFPKFYIKTGIQEEVKVTASLCFRKILILPKNFSLDIFGPRIDISHYIFDYFVFLDNFKVRIGGPLLHCTKNEVFH